MGNMMRRTSTIHKISRENPENFLKDSEDDIVVVLEDYPSPELRKPVCRMGEKLRLIATEGHWWKVRSIQTGKENYIPNSHAARVYHGWLFEGVGRQKAEELLLLPVNKVGSFLVRESRRERGLYSLSVKHMIVMHYRIFRLENSWYYISPRLTFQCLEDLINHYSDAAEGLCCMLTSPCLSGTPLPSEANPAAPPVVMRHNFDLEKVKRDQLVNLDSCGDDTVSYGVRNSMAAYLSFSAHEQPTQVRALGRKKKSKSVYGLPAHTDNGEDF